MAELIKYTLEFPIQSSIKILYERLSTPNGLAKWFADDITIKDKIFTFYWFKLVFSDAPNTAKE